MSYRRALPKAALVAATAGALAAGLLAAPPAGSAPSAPTAADLEQTGPDQQRWLSLPDSRIVVNPFNFQSQASALEQSTGPELPLHLGYFAGDDGYALNDLMSVYQRPPGAPPGGGTTIDFEDDFTTLDPAWSAEPGLQYGVTNGRLELSLPQGGPAWAALTRRVTVDLDQYPSMQIRVPQAGAGTAWALKVNDGQPVDTFVQSDSVATGVFTYDIAELTGWEGVKTFDIRIFIVGQGAPAAFDEIRMQSNVEPWLRTATEQEHSWLPHTLPYSASYADGMQVAGEDFLHDRNSVTRTLAFDDLPTDGSSVVLSGAYSGALAFDAATNAVTVRSGPYEYTADLPGSGGQLKYYASAEDLLVGGPELTAPGDTGVWALGLAVPPGQTSHDVAVGVGFATTAEPAGSATQRAAAAATSPGPAQWEAFWTDQLAGVPHPQSFGLTAVDGLGVTAADVRDSYYVAWTTLLANVLPAQPEAGFDYRQIAEGKASLWTEGAEGARASTNWTSFMAVQYLAYVDPDLAWEIFEGMMSLVDEDGMIGGEGLPTRRAQGAWVLYQVTDDLDRLEQSYDALRLNLLWSKANPRWIYGTNDNPNERDADFVASALIDLGYAQQIADALGRPDEVTFWEQQHDELFADYLEWFWDTPTSEPLEYRHLNDWWSHRGTTLWVSQGLHVPALTGDHLTGLLNRFLGEYDPTVEFGGFAFPNVKFAEVENVTYGLLDQGLVDEATEFSQLVLRDVIRTGEFGEVYDLGPTALGVRPSLFGTLNVVHAVLLMNGLRIDQGDPMFVALPGATGGVSGLTLHDRSLNVKVSASKERVILSGSLVRGPATCRILEAPLGKTVAPPPHC